MENGTPRKRGQLSPAEKWEVLGGHLAATDAGRRRPKVGRRREHGDPDPAAGQGRGAGRVRRLQAGADALPRAAELEAAVAENDRLSEALKEMAVELTLHGGRQRSGFSARSRRA
jgi:hypothetical protein